MIARLALVLLAVAAPVEAAVRSSSAAGFEIENKLVTKADPADVFAALGRVGAWWNPSHTYSRNSENLSLELRPGGCFCEKLKDGGGVEHMRVVFLRPNDTLRLQGGLGPLQPQGVSGSMTFSLKAVPGGGTEITHTYVVGGFAQPVAEQLAAPVDKMLAEQLARLGRHLSERALRIAE